MSLCLQMDGNKDLILSSQLISTFDLIFGFNLLKVCFYNSYLILL